MHAIGRYPVGGKDCLVSLEMRRNGQPRLMANPSGRIAGPDGEQSVT